jgi:hypothetical protein
MKYINKMGLLQQDLSDEATQVGKLATRRASSQKTGGGIGGLLGGILGQILIPIPGVGAAIGAGLGGWAGSEAGEALSGVDEDDLRGGKFLKDSRNSIIDEMASNKLTSSLMQAAKAGLTSGFSPGGGIYGKGANILQDTMKYGAGDAFKHEMARSSLEGASKYGDLMAKNITARGLEDNSWLAEVDDFFAEDLLNPEITDLNLNQSIEPWIQKHQVPWAKPGPDNYSVGKFLE